MRFNWKWAIPLVPFNLGIAIALAQGIFIFVGPAAGKYLAPVAAILTVLRLFLLTAPLMFPYEDE